MENFNFDKLDSSDDQPIKELVDKVQYDTFCSAYDCISEMGVGFLIAKGSKYPMKLMKGLIDYFQHPDREEYEKCAILLSAAKKFKKERDKKKDALKNLNIKKQNIKKNTKKL